VVQTTKRRDTVDELHTAFVNQLRSTLRPSTLAEIIHDLENSERQTPILGDFRQRCQEQGEILVGVDEFAKLQQEADER
jgi:hypothetical protein